MTEDLIVFWVLLALVFGSIIVGLGVNSWLTRQRRNEPTFWEETDR